MRRGSEMVTSFRCSPRNASSWVSAVVVCWHRKGQGPWQCCTAVTGAGVRLTMEELSYLVKMSSVSSNAKSFWTPDIRQNTGTPELRQN